MRTSNKKAAAAAPPELPTDILLEILSRLRVRPLIKLKSVCKAWHHLISSEEFIKLHLKRSSLTRTIRLRLRDTCPGLDNWRDGGRVLPLGSSCDGLFCVFDRRHTVIHIWNPSIRKSAAISIRNIPIPITLRKPQTKLEDMITCFWFGLNDNEYKVVVGTMSSSSQMQMHIIRPYNTGNYSQKSVQELAGKTAQDEWTAIRGFWEQIGTLFNGVVHWPASVFGNDFDGVMYERGRIYALNLGKEEAKEFYLPIEIEAQCFHLGEVDGCLSAMLMPPSGWPYEIWAMKEYGVEESWTKIMVVTDDYFFAYYALCSTKIMRLKKVLDGDPATYKSPIYYDSKHQFYVESLVSPNQD